MDKPPGYKNTMRTDKAIEQNREATRKRMAKLRIPARVKGWADIYARWSVYGDGEPFVTWVASKYGLPRRLGR